MMGARPRIAPLFALGMVVAAFGPPPPAEAADSAVVFMYHRFGETSWPSTNIRIDQFEAHLKELSEGGYKVLALPTILSALKRGEELPDKTIALTIDDAYLSVYTAAWPRLKAARFPFTLFVATNPIDANLRNYMNWDQIRELARPASPSAARPRVTFIWSILPPAVTPPISRNPTPASPPNWVRSRNFSLTPTARRAWPCRRW